MKNNKNNFNHYRLPIILFITVGFFLYYSISVGNSNSSSLDLLGKVLTYAPQIDITTCEVLAQCDCCAGNYLFINKRDFVAIEYCGADKSYSRGTYEIQDRIVTLRFDGLVIDRFFNWSSEVDTKAADKTKYIISERRVDPSKITLTLLDCEKNVLFDTGIEETPFAAINNDYELSELVNQIKEYGLWEKLNLK